MRTVAHNILSTSGPVNGVIERLVVEFLCEGERIVKYYDDVNELAVDDFIESKKVDIYNYLANKEFLLMQNGFSTKDPVSMLSDLKFISMGDGVKIAIEYGLDIDDIDVLVSYEKSVEYLQSNFTTPELSALTGLSEGDITLFYDRVNTCLSQPYKAALGYIAATSRSVG